MKKQIEWHDIQAFVFGGYGRLPLARYVFLRMEDGSRAKRWLRGLAEEVTTMERFNLARVRGEWERHALHVAFTAAGLSRLGLPPEVLGSFLPEFVEGMTAEHRARALGDTGASAPQGWQFGGPDKGAKDERDIHLVLLLFTEGDAAHPEEMDGFHARHRRRYEAHGLREVFVQDACLHAMDPHGGTELSFREAFGFRDGISQPTIEGTRQRPGQEPPIKAGEFLLGYENSYEQLPSTPTVPSELDLQGVLPALEGSAAKDLGCNGTYLVIRKLKQDVEAFERFLSEHAHDPADPGGDARRREWLAAKMMGRWRSGAPLSLCPEQDDRALGADPSRNNDFQYADDVHGLRCPVSSHIRRSNPRDALVPGKPKVSRTVSDRHRIIRRGRPYQERGGEQGMLFMALNANLRRQFELIQQSWLNNPRFGGHYDSRDPIVGDNHDPAVEGDRAESYTVTIPAEPVRQRLTGLPRFVHVRGGGYFFLPGIQALRFLATAFQRGGPPAEEQR